MGDEGKKVWHRDMRRSVEGKGMERGTQGKQGGHNKYFQEGNQGV